MNGEKWKVDVDAAWKWRDDDVDYWKSAHECNGVWYYKVKLAMELESESTIAMESETKGKVTIATVKKLYGEFSMCTFI